MRIGGAIFEISKSAPCPDCLCRFEYKYTQEKYQQDIQIFYLIINEADSDSIHSVYITACLIFITMYVCIAICVFVHVSAYIRRDTTRQQQSKHFIPNI